MKKTIYEGEVGIVWKNGVIVRRVNSGRHAYSLWRNEKITTVNIQRQEYLCQVQEYTTKDNLTVRFSVLVYAQIRDAIRFRKEIPEHTHEMYIKNQTCNSARSLFAAYTLDELLDKSDQLHILIAEKVSPKLKDIGIELIEIAPISVLIPRTLRQAFEAEISVRKRAVADLEEARGRTAVLRHLSNAAGMVEKQPVLLQLLMGQKARQVQFQFDDRGRSQSLSKNVSSVVDKDKSK